MSSKRLFKGKIDGEDVMVISRWDSFNMEGCYIFFKVDKLGVFEEIKKVSMSEHTNTIKEYGMIYIKDDFKVFFGNPTNENIADYLKSLEE